MLKIRIFAAILMLATAGMAFFVFKTESEDSRFNFKLGLDLRGGTHLVYEADTSFVDRSEVDDAMNSLRDVIERRVNLFGVSEPIVQVEQGGLIGEGSERLIVELPGVANVDEAVKLIGQTPLLEFRLLKNDDSLPESGKEIEAEEYETYFERTGLTGRYLKRANLEFGTGQSTQLTGAPTVTIEFDNEGAKLFAEITGNNVGKILAIFLDGVPISTPVIQQEIIGGQAVITGSFSPQEASTLVRNLNYGALPLPISLLSSQTIGSTLGENTLKEGIKAGFLGLILIAVFMIVWYRLPGALAVLSLATYLFIMALFFKLIPVTLTAAGIAGFILSVGMAVDANVLIFERVKEELKKTNNLNQAIKLGFKRAWLSIRDSNISSIITAVILFWFGTSLVEGFALTFGLGVIVSMFSAILVSRTLLLSVGLHENISKKFRFLFGSGLK